MRVGMFESGHVSQKASVTEGKCHRKQVSQKASFTEGKCHRRQVSLKYAIAGFNCTFLLLFLHYL